MEYRGSKSVIITVKEQRVDGYTVIRFYILVICIRSLIYHNKKQI